MNSHRRVIPRDFFNEANLLKCLGKLEIFIMENPGNRFLQMHSEHDGEAFEIKQDRSDGSIYVSNYKLFIKGERAFPFITYNSREKWPLQIKYKDSYYYCFDEEGNFMPNFGVEK